MSNVVQETYTKVTPESSLWLLRSASAFPCVQSRPFFSELSMNQRHPIITTPKARYMRTSITAKPLQPVWCSRTGLILRELAPRKGPDLHNA